MKSKIICVDFDGVICKFNYQEWEKSGYKNAFLEEDIIPGVRPMLKILSQNGYKIVIHTSRVTTKFKNIDFEIHQPNYKISVKDITKFLKKSSIYFDEIWSGCGKPVADYYIDDKAIRFNNWLQVFDELMALERD